MGVNSHDNFSVKSLRRKVIKLRVRAINGLSTCLTSDLETDSKIINIVLTTCKVNNFISNGYQ